MKRAKTSMSRSIGFHLLPHPSSPQRILVKSGLLRNALLDREFKMIEEIKATFGIIGMALSILLFLFVMSLLGKLIVEFCYRYI